MDSFIVTVSCASNLNADAFEADAFEVDLEIPSRLTFAEFKGKLLEALPALDGNKLGGCRDYRLEFRESAIESDETLAHIGAFDGSILRLYPITG